MKLTVYSKDKVRDIDIFTYNVIDIINSLENDFEIKHIDKVKLIVTLVSKGDKSIRKLEREMDKITSCSSAKMDIKKTSKFFFDFILEGKLGDVFGAIFALDISHLFTRLDTYMRNDIKLIKILAYNGNLRFDHNLSLIIRFLSEKNSNMNYNSVYDILRRDIKKTELRKFLPDLFKEIYGFPMEKAVFTSTQDKLNLNSLDDNIIAEIDSDLRVRINIEND